MDKLWQLLDIAYVIPATVFIGYLVAGFLESKYEGDFMVPSVLIALFLGFILTIVKIKRVIDAVNKPKSKANTEENS